MCKSMHLSGSERKIKRCAKRCRLTKEGSDGMFKLAARHYGRYERPEMPSPFQAQSCFGSDFSASQGHS
jgi:hypothetical protein